jgi:hypothetical protein
MKDTACGTAAVALLLSDATRKQLRALHIRGGEAQLDLKKYQHRIQGVTPHARSGLLDFKK